MDRAHNIESVSITGKAMRLRVDGADYEIDLATQSKRIAGARPEQVSDFTVSPSGYGIHWAQLDEDLSIDGLIGIKHSNTEAKTTA